MLGAHVSRCQIRFDENEIWVSVVCVKVYHLWPESGGYGGCCDCALRSGPSRCWASELCSSLCRICAVRAGESTEGRATPWYGDSYCPLCLMLEPASSPVRKYSSGSDLEDRPRLLFPEDELEWLALAGAVGVKIEESCIRPAGCGIGLGGSETGG